ncbi:hypothetical protein NL676_025394 [Syzygium grande]|nr:hypothetical protein NL676_025394 [Syzygium grande]
MVFNMRTSSVSSTSEDCSRDDISDRGGSDDISDRGSDDISDRGGSDDIFDRIGFISRMRRGNKLVDLVDFEGASDYEMKRVEMFAEIAVKCLDQSRANRPAMRVVARRLAAIHLGLAVEEVEENIEEIWE